MYIFCSVRSLNISPTPSLAEDLQGNNVSVNAIPLPEQSPRLIRARLPRDETCEEDDPDEIGKNQINIQDEFLMFNIKFL